MRILEAEEKKAEDLQLELAQIDHGGDEGPTEDNDEPLDGIDSGLEELEPAPGDGRRRERLQSLSFVNVCVLARDA